ncbi:MAG: hypothetical protein IT435_14075 [Phycisphaerales bacterium]|nr:hypothetical protein [Phycisphaerales bacterium]
MLHSFVPSPRDGDNQRPEGPSSVLVVATLASLGASAIVALAYWLGALWLSESAMGLPAGVWIVVLLAAWSAGAERRRVTGRTRGHSGSVGTHEAGLIEAGGGSRWERVVAGLARMAAWIDQRLSLMPMGGAWSVGGSGFDSRWRRMLLRWLPRLGMPEAPLRIGMAMGRRKAEQIAEQDSMGIRWLMLPRSAEAWSSASEHGLDAVLIEPAPGVVRVCTLEREGCDSSWFDWSHRRPLSYEAVFPLRIDPSHVSLDLSSESDAPRCAEMIAALARAAAIWSRHPARLGVEDLVLGRRPVVTGSNGSDGVESIGWSRDAISAAMIGLAQRLESDGSTLRATAADRAAARAVSAWVSSWDESIADDQRRRWAEACVRILPEEPEVMLRLAAVRLSAFDDEMGIAALRDADAILQHESGLLAADPVAFLQAELEHGPENPMTVARVAAGLCLAFAGVPTKRLAFLQEDLLDDMRFANWLIGRDQDRALLIRILRELREARERRESIAADELPPARAA